MRGGGGGGGGGGLSKLAIALIVISVFLLVVFFAQLFYVMWRHRVFRRQTEAAGDGGRGDAVSQYSSSESNSTTATYSKELLYFFSIRPHFLLGSSNSTDIDLNSDQQSDIEAVDIDLLKIHGIFGPPRFLFTIKEEDKEATESPGVKPVRPIKMEEKRELVDDNRSSADSENLAAAEEDEEEEMIGNPSVDDATPFSTPCGSPVYFTPTASPVHEQINCRSGSGEVAFI